MFAILIQVPRTKVVKIHEKSFFNQRNETTLNYSSKIFIQYLIKFDTNMIKFIFI